MKNWRYEKGTFYVSGDGIHIFYIERNPCRCCPNSYLIERDLPALKKKTAVFITNGTGFKFYIKSYRLRELK